jgi:hypothetical protein
MKTGLIVSCPHCGNETTVSMQMWHDEFQEIENILTCIAPNIKKYSFHGEAKCDCREMILATLTVTGGSCNGTA